MNFTFKDKGKQVLSTEIIQHVMDEMRQERKIAMVLKDTNVDTYITQDLTEIDLYDENTFQDLEVEIKNTIQDKLTFRAEFA